MKINPADINDIILDLGGVVVDLDPDSTIREFAALGFKGLENRALIMSRYPFIEAYETGKIGTNEFVDAIQRIIKNNVGPEKIIAAWNRLVLDLEDDVLHLIQNLRKRYRLSLLSNTNALHIKSFNEKLFKQHGLNDLREVFDIVYYSYELGMRKPDREIFEFVLKDLGAAAPATLYVDDTQEHILSAERLGIKTYCLRPPQKITGLLDSFQ